MPPGEFSDVIVNDSASHFRDNIGFMEQDSVCFVSFRSGGYHCTYSASTLRTDYWDLKLDNVVGRTLRNRCAVDPTVLGSSWKLDHAIR